MSNAVQSTSTSTPSYSAVPPESEDPSGDRKSSFKEIKSNLKDLNSSAKDIDKALKAKEKEEPGTDADIQKSRQDVKDVRNDIKDVTKALKDMEKDETADPAKQQALMESWLKLTEDQDKLMNGLPDAMDTSTDATTADETQ